MATKTMGSKRNQKEATQEDVKMEQDVKKATARRQSTKTATQPEGRQRPATKKRLRSDRPSAGFWYMQDTPELAGVTDEASNPELGIRGITVREPSERQWELGTLAVVTLETIIGQVRGIQVLDSEFDNSVYMRMQSRSWEGNDGKKNYVNDLVLDKKVEAQILRYVSSLLVDAQ